MGEGEKRLFAAAGLALILCGAARAAPASSAFVVLGPDGAAVARVITDTRSCPALVVDGARLAMSLRAGPGTLPLRPTASPPALSKPAAFEVSVCEAPLPAGARRARLEDGRRLPLPPKTVRRLVVIGDTGCRIKTSDRAAQACNDPAAYPFARLAAAAAAFRPDLVVHVGDYLYRENPCPPAAAGCSGSPWGYGWDAWKADFFDPAAPLLAAAPLALARGNHETCVRAGQGWWRLLAATPLEAGRDCIDPANDGRGDYARPYAVPLGEGTQLILLDSANVPARPLAAGDPRALEYAADYDAIAALVRQARSSLLVDHHPMLGFAAVAGKDGRPDLRPGNLALQSVFFARNPRLVPDGVDVLLSGHVHVFEALSFAGVFPSQFVTGFSGTQEDIVPLPESLSDGDDPAPGATPDAFSSWVDGFGFMTLERTGPADWKAEIHDKTGKVVNRCAIKGRESHCDIKQVHAG
jgi:hypothetical protein